MTAENQRAAVSLPLTSTETLPAKIHHEESTATPELHHCRSQRLSSSCRAQLSSPNSRSSSQLRPSLLNTQLSSRLQNFWESNCCGQEERMNAAAQLKTCCCRRSSAERSLSTVLCAASTAQRSSSQLRPSLLNTQLSSTLQNFWESNCCGQEERMNAAAQLKVVMFSLNRAVLLVTLFSDFRIYEAASSPVHRREVPRGHSVTLTCNLSLEDAADVRWTKGNLSFLHSFILNATVSNFSSPRLRIETDLPSQLMILNVQDEDEGLYSCTVTNWNGLQQTRWNLTLTEEVKDSLQFPFKVSVFMLNTIEEDDRREHGDEGKEFQL
ncbi:hypothetical protein FQA47_023755 [Oryzias melastigma]|uniref:Ig-like domain-containing protein n=1 Tax=Oryzias melastigma TaxID=30732 RepID=A0A834BXB2_ORYME|nr:hypothetical protein FQA47_023755 [Oryzias melastigma]